VENTNLGKILKKLQNWI